MTMDDFRWAPLPDEMREQTLDMRWFHATSDIQPGGKVVAIGGFCDLRKEDASTMSFSCSIVEFVELSTGRRVPIDERGFTIGYRSTSTESLVPACTETLDSLTGFVLNTVLPDDDEDPEDHPWEWLAHQSRESGVDTSADDLRVLEYRVVFSDRIHQWLGNSVEPWATEEPGSG